MHVIETTTNMAEKHERPCGLTLNLRSISPNEYSSGSCERYSRYSVTTVFLKRWVIVFCCFLFESITDAPPQTPSSPLKAKPENVRMFRRSNKTVYTAGKSKIIFGTRKAVSYLPHWQLKGKYKRVSFDLRLLVFVVSLYMLHLFYRVE